MTRSEAYLVIDTEREYQENLGSDRTDGASHTVGDYGVMLHYYLREFDEAWTKNAGTEKALEAIRKIAGIAVHCIEDHGAPKRTF
jgi:hypothetical protein